MAIFSNCKLSDITSNDVLKVDAYWADRSIFLPEASTVPGKVFTVKKDDYGTQKVLVYAYGSEMIDDYYSWKELYNFGDILRVVSDGSNWVELNQKAYQPPKKFVFTSSGTYNRTPGVLYAKVTVIGGGGGGSGGSGTGGAGANGVVIVEEFFQ